MSSNTKITVFIYITAVFLFVADRLLKYFSLHGFFDNSIGDWLNITFVPNPYIAFSIPLGGIILNLFIALILIVLLYYYLLFFKNKDYLNASLLFMVFLGAASNYADRLKLGFVIDYLDLKYFTVFNIADAMIVSGVFLIFILNLKKEK